MPDTGGGTVRQAPEDYDAVVIGAGFAGLYMVHRLRESGFSVRDLEAGDGVGGTWYWNRYPGARCDSESMYYSYSFLPEFEQDWPLEQRYPGQPVILKYLQTVAERLDLLIGLLRRQAGRAHRHRVIRCAGAA
jgi:cyclohexanone monooxygenase